MTLGNIWTNTTIHPILIKSISGIIALLDTEIAGGWYSGKIVQLNETGDYVGDGKIIVINGSSTVWSAL